MKTLCEAAYGLLFPSLPLAVYKNVINIAWKRGKVNHKNSRLVGLWIYSHFAAAKESGIVLSKQSFWNMRESLDISKKAVL